MENINSLLGNEKQILDQCSQQDQNVIDNTIDILLKEISKDKGYDNGLKFIYKLMELNNKYVIERIKTVLFLRIEYLALEIFEKELRKQIKIWSMWYPHDDKIQQIQKKIENKFKPLSIPQIQQRKPVNLLQKQNKLTPYQMNIVKKFDSAFKQSLSFKQNLRIYISGLQISGSQHTLQQIQQLQHTIQNITQCLKLVTSLPQQLNEGLQQLQKEKKELEFIMKIFQSFENDQLNFKILVKTIQDNVNLDQTIYNQKFFKINKQSQFNMLENEQQEKQNRLLIQRQKEDNLRQQQQQLLQSKINDQQQFQSSVQKSKQNQQNNQDFKKPIPQFNYEYEQNRNLEVQGKTPKKFYEPALTPITNNDKSQMKNSIHITQKLDINFNKRNNEQNIQQYESNDNMEIGDENKQPIDIQCMNVLKRAIDSPNIKIPKILSPIKNDNQNPTVQHFNIDLQSMNQEIDNSRLSDSRSLTQFMIYNDDLNNNNSNLLNNNQTNKLNISNNISEVYQNKQINNNFSDIQKIDLSLNQKFNQSQILFKNQSQFAFNDNMQIKLDNFNDFDKKQPIFGIEKLKQDCQLNYFYGFQKENAFRYDEHFEINIENLPEGGGYWIYKSQFELISKDLVYQEKRDIQTRLIQINLHQPKYIRYVHLLVLTENEQYHKYVYEQFLDIIYNNILEQFGDCQLQKECILVWGALFPKYFDLHLKSLKKEIGKFGRVYQLFVTEDLVVKAFERVQNLNKFNIIYTDDDFDSWNLYEQTNSQIENLLAIQILALSLGHKEDFQTIGNTLSKIKFYLKKYNKTLLSRNKLQFFLQSFLNQDVKVSQAFAEDEKKMLLTTFSSVFQYQLNDIQHKNSLLQELSQPFIFLLLYKQPTVELAEFQLNTQKLMFIMLFFIKEIFGFGKKDQKEYIIHVFFKELYYYLNNDPPKSSKTYDFNQLVFECLMMQYPLFKDFYPKFEFKIKFEESPNSLNVRIESYDEGVFSPYLNTQYLFQQIFPTAFENQDVKLINKALDQLNQNYLKVKYILKITILKIFTIIFILHKLIFQISQIKEQNLLQNQRIYLLLKVLRSILSIQRIQEKQSVQYFMLQFNILLPQEEYFQPQTRDLRQTKFKQITSDIDKDKLQNNYKQNQAVQISQIQSVNKSTSQLLQTSFIKSQFWNHPLNDTQNRSQMSFNQSFAFRNQSARNYSNYLSKSKFNN